MCRFLILLSLIASALLCGCPEVSPTVVVPPASPEVTLIGLSLEEIQTQLGPPDTTFRSDEPFWGPRPKSLQQGDPYTTISYRNYQGQQLYLFLVAPEVYQRMRGKLPGERSLYVVEVLTLPLGTVF